jgi:3-oxoacyl-[acyl-carrier protein] reductase
MDLGLAGRVYVLTGASRGLGYATAECLVADGANVVVSARSTEGVMAAVQRLGAPERAIGVVADLGDPMAVERLLAAARERFGRVDGALISVGGPPRGTAATLDDAQWRESFETVFLGSVRLARGAAEAIGRDGAIGFVLSTSVRSPLAGLGLSNALRPGLAGVAKDMSDEYGPRGIRVFSLLPGRILTDRNRELFEATGDPERARREAEAAIPMGRLGEPAEFGRVAAFLLSPAASYLTGLSIPVDGGSVRAL